MAWIEGQDFAAQKYKAEQYRVDQTFQAGKGHYFFLEWSGPQPFSLLGQVAFEPPRKLDMHAGRSAADHNGYSVHVLVKNYL